MANLPTQLPKNWNPQFTKPHQPYGEPMLHLKKRDVLETFKLSNWSDFTPPPGTDIIHVEAECDYVYDSCEVTIIASACGPEYEVPNPDYDKHKKKYDKSVELYEVALKEWKHLKKLYEAEQETQEQELYRKLKKKYDK